MDKPEAQTPEEKDPILEMHRAAMRRRAEMKNKENDAVAKLVADAVMQRLAPFIADLKTVAEKLGKVSTAAAGNEVAPAVKPNK